MTSGNGKDVDRAIAAALQVNGRASWGAVARALDIPERTAARRGQRLLDDGTVRVSTYLDVARVAHARGILLRAEIETRRVHEVAAILAHRADASSVSILEGSGNIAGYFLPPDPDALNRFLFRDLPDLTGLISFDVGTVLKLHRSGYDWNAGGLPDHVVQQLTEGLWTADRTVNANVHIDDTDRQLIDLLAIDGRAAISSLATDVGVSAQTARRKVDALFSSGVLHVRTEVTPAIFGLSVEAVMWLRAPSALSDELGRALGAHRSVRFCASSTGHASFLIDVLVEDEDELYAFQTDVIGRFPDVQIDEARIVMQAVRRGPLLVLDSPAS
ncbi:MULTISPECIES: Lrp/AsnC family transcriptional regulator [unclassified Cryobacterium]|uniref:Lrp/AsnC family transcriptional regulator n=1 Tax=unclassified Cryobacterium TaxID=2649013 RepID=UPI00144742AF|nr:MULTISPECIES: Lrp/AsnC family transcriptional regulator [unclassified Cryobacterium]